MCRGACAWQILRLRKARGKGREGSCCDFKGIFSPWRLAGQKKLALRVELDAYQATNRDEEGSVLIY